MSRHCKYMYELLNNHRLIVCNIFSEVLNRPFPNFEMIIILKIKSKILQKKLFKFTPTFSTYFLYCFCVIFEEVQWRFFTFQYLFKMLIRFNLRYIVDFLTPRSFTISINLLYSLNPIRMQPCPYVTFNMLFFYNLMIVSHSLTIGIAPL